jgi:hypothetical protein
MLEPVVFDRSAEKRMSDARIDLFFLERLRAAIRAGASKPQFFAAHYTRPGHTPLEYRNSPPELRAFQSYYRKSSDSAAIMLDKMLTEIRAGDPTAIVFVFGDHGSGVSRGLEYSDNPEFVVQDRHGILGAVFGTETCLPYLRPPGDERFQTSSRAVAALLQCLAGGESPLSMAYDFGRIQQVPNEMRFENYVYE